MTQRNTMLTQEEFIARAKQVWGDKFDLSKAIYRGRKQKIEVVCPKHGSFFPSATNFLAGWGCKQCGIEARAEKRTSNTEEFIEKARKLYGDLYDYSKVDYVNSRTKVIIVCKKHGEFSVTPSNFLQGYTCRKCGYECNALNATKTTEQFISDAQKIHGETYDYSLVEYKDSKTPVSIMCRTHGVFEQIPKSHLRGSGCPICASSKRVHTYENEKFIEMSRELYGDKFEYSQCNYVGMHSHVQIICKKHGVFNVLAATHLKQNGGCPECKKERIGELHRYTTKDFINKAQEKHGKTYDYSNVEYVNSYTPLRIICATHGEFKQSAYIHLYGHGCPRCNNSTGEEEISVFLEKNDIEYIREKTFQDCKDVGFLRFDFYLPKYNLCIEYQGIQHYKPLEIFGGQEEYEERIKRDMIKREYCKKHNISLLEIKYNEEIKDKLKFLTTNQEETI